jgi:hypothetical protein
VIVDFLDVQSGWKDNGMVSIFTASTRLDERHAQLDGIYPSYADRRWLGGERGPDRALATVVKGVRTMATQAGEPVADRPESLLAAMVHLAEMAERIDWALLSLVAEARASGVSWSAVGTSLGVSKQAAQQRFAPYVKQALDQAPDPDPR